MLVSADELGLNQSVETILRGELVAFPTDTYFALGANGLNPRAIEAVFRTKGRNPGTPVPLLISDINMVGNLASEFPSSLKKLAKEFWPGALTVVLPAAEIVPSVVSAGSGTVGLRIPDNNIAKELIQRSGVPITGTSCNLTGHDPIKDASEIDQIFGGLIAVCLDSECGNSTAPSTVVAYEDKKIILLRTGAISAESIQNIVGDIVVK
ncbi:MAG: L-threonylcarbamoyladenylate synthase [Dehalococcoidia bacterium]|jgi:L-threonylcarbamoyladenylate synthase|nr:L-threonylcarbamoyladenylate synthase [Dehalococcoidia bacterium]